MKKVMYTLGILGTLSLVSCAEDKGTSKEVADANANEMVKPSNINDYDRPGTAGSNVSADYVDATYMRHAQMTKKGNKDLQNATATQLVEYYYRDNLKPGEVQMDTSYSETAQMGGRTNQAKAAKQENETQNGGTTDSGSQQSNKSEAKKQTKDNN